MGLSSQLRGGSSRSQQRNDLVEAFRTSLVSLHFCGFTRWFVVAGWLQTKIMASQPTPTPLRNCNPPQEIAGFFIRRPYSWVGGGWGRPVMRPAWQSVPLGGGRVASRHYFVGYRPDGEVRHIAPTTGHITQELSDNLPPVLSTPLFFWTWKKVHKTNIGSPTVISFWEWIFNRGWYKILEVIGIHSLDTIPYTLHGTENVYLHDLTWMA